MIRVSIFLAVLLLGYASLSGVGRAAHAEDLVGKGEWQSLKGEAIRGTWTVDLARTGSGLRGTIALTGSTLFVGGVVNGTIDGQQVVLGVMAEGVKQATFSGKLDGESVSGEWDCPAIKDEGVWFGTLRMRQSGS